MSTKYNSVARRHFSKRSHLDIQVNSESLVECLGHVHRSSFVNLAPVNYSRTMYVICAAAMFPAEQVLF